MNYKIDLENRLQHIEEICETYIDTPGFPKNVVMKHLIGIAKGEIKKQIFINNDLMQGEYGS